MLESILHFSIKNRWLVVLLTGAVALVGLDHLRRLPIDAVPDITNNQVQINALAPSLSPFEVEQQVTWPIENALAGIPGLQHTRPLSRNGFAQITAVFDDRVSIYFARQQVGERLREANSRLPAGVEPVMGPIATGLGEISMYTVEYAHPRGESATFTPGKPGWQRPGEYRTPEGRTLTSDLEQSAYLREVQDWIIRPQLRNVPGVAGVDSIGGFVKQYHVQPDPMKLVSYGLTFTDLIQALEQSNASTGAGFIERSGESALVRVAGRIASPSDLESIVVASRNGVPIAVRDLVVPGGVGVGRELRTGSASENGQDVVVGTAMMLLGANSRTVAAAVEERLTEIRRSLPPGIVVKSVLNRTKLVDATIATVRRNLVEGAILVIIVLLLLLGNWRAALICSLAIPLSMLMTATGMVRSGLSGNLMSLGAIDFGLIVDGAVIIVENCLRRLAEEQKAKGRLLTLTERLHVVSLASKEVRTATAFGEAIIITVYIPILALTGVEGKMFHPMALTVILALVAAFILSLTFVPAMVALCISGPVAEHDMFLVRWAKAIYQPVVRWAISRRAAVVIAAALFFVGSLALFTRLGQEFVPTLDEQDIAMHAVRVASTGLDQSQDLQREVERTVASFPEVRFVFSKTGTAELASDPMPPNVSDTFIILKDRNQWRTEAELQRLLIEKQVQPLPTTHKAKLIALLEHTLQAVPGNNYEFTQPIQMRFNELISGVRGDVAIKVTGDDFESMQQTAAAVLETLRSVPGAADAKVEQTDGLPVLTITPDRSALARHALRVADVQAVIAAAIGGQPAGLLFEGDRRFEIVVRLPDALRQDPATLAQLPIPLPRDTERPVDQTSPATPGAANALTPSPTVGFVPLGSVARIELTEGINQITRENAKRRVVVQCNVRGRDLGSFVSEAQTRIAQIPLPPANCSSGAANTRTSSPPRPDSPSSSPPASRSSSCCSSPPSRTHATPCSSSPPYPSASPAASSPSGSATCPSPSPPPSASSPSPASPSSTASS
ncbi:MAG: CusA/CzcA family heavy metal efflux RND transporter [Phycisphaerales bacterium]|nr:CusA/CzcA family heavy metal efflux RND transporter [Phycisphaerales bacterium]